MRKYRTIAAMAAVCAAAILAGYAMNDGYAGKDVLIVLPAAEARYDNAGTHARDDETLYGMAGTVREGVDGDGYCLVETEYGYPARLRKNALILRSRAPEEWRGAASHVVAGAFADVVAAPDLKAYPPLSVLPRGAVLRVIGEEGKYSAVRMHNGNAGYVRSELLRKIRSWADSDEKTNRRRVVEDAMAYLGVSYRWGGKTPEGIDCSGLASMAYLMNGLAIYRNAGPRAGYPVALMHLDAPAGGHTAKSLARAKPGDLLYWKGHQAVYLGDGGYVHANATSFDVRVNSLVKDAEDFRGDLGDPEAILSWGTVYPEKPEELIVRRFVAVATGEKNEFRFFARLDGYAPTEAVLYPEGVGEGRPAIEIDNPGQMVYGAIEADNKNAPTHRYDTPGKYYPTVVFANVDGWLPAGKRVACEPFVMAEAVIAE